MESQNIRPGHEWDRFEGLNLGEDKLSAFLNNVPFFSKGRRRYLAPTVPVPEALTVEHGAYVANMCIGCHGIPGYKTAFPSVYHVPKIAGQQQAYLFNALKAYKSGERSHPSMRGIAASLTEEDMAAYAAYYGAPAK